MAFTPNAKASTGSRTQYDIIKAREIVSGLDMLKPDVKNELIRAYGLDSLGRWFREKGKMSGINNLQSYHMEKEAIRSNFTVSAQSGTTDQETITVASASTTTTSEAESPFIATGSRTSYPVVQYDVIEFHNGVQAVVTSMSGAVASVTTVDGSNIPTVGSNSVRVISKVVPEASNSVTSKFTQFTGYQSQLSRIRNTVEITGDALGTVDWAENLGEGQNSNRLFAEEILDGYVNHENDIELALLAGQKITNTDLADVTGFETIQSTEGYIPWLETNANVETYTGSISLDEFDNVIDNLSKYRGAKEYDCFGELTAIRDIDDFLRAETGLNNGGVVYSTADQEKYINFGFGSFMRTNVSFHFKHLPVFNLPEYLGGEKYVGMLLGMPVGNASITQDNKDINVPACEILYSMRDDLDMGYKEWYHGGAAPNHTNGEDLVKYEYHSVLGFRGVAANRHFIMKK